MPRPGAWQQEGLDRLGGAPGELSPQPRDDPGGSYGHQTKLNGKWKEREYNSLSQNDMNPQTLGSQLYAFQEPKGKSQSGQCWGGARSAPSRRMSLLLGHGFGHQCKTNLSMEQGPLAPPQGLPLKRWGPPRDPLSDCGDTGSSEEHLGLKSPTGQKCGTA